jgi:(E)-4-hydroxy-3-methylbut-2-enyl-diphosphate synthase
MSRIHASRRVFDALKRHGSQLSVLHHIRFPAGDDRDNIVINTGTLVRRGGLVRFAH